MHATTIGLDIAKSVFQVHGVGGRGEVVHRRRLKRRDVEAFFAKQPRALIGIEACGTSHQWARVLTRQGHEVRLMPPAYVKPYVKRNKTDARDAEAICEAVCRPTMRFVPVKSEAQQAARALHRVRDLLVRQRTQLANVIRGLSAEFGMVEPVGAAGFSALVARLAQEEQAKEEQAKEEQQRRRGRQRPRATVVEPGPARFQRRYARFWSGWRSNGASSAPRSTISPRASSPRASATRRPAA